MSRVDGSKILILRVKLQIFPAVFVNICPQFISRLFEESALLEEFNYLCVFVEELLQVGLEVGYQQGLGGIIAAISHLTLKLLYQQR